MRLSDVAAGALAQHGGKLKLDNFTARSDGPGHRRLAAKLAAQDDD
jgi:hypothetical protein